MVSLRLPCPQVVYMVSCMWFPSCSLKLVAAPFDLYYFAHVCPSVPLCMSWFDVLYMVLCMMIPSCSIVLAIVVYLSVFGGFLSIIAKLVLVVFKCCCGCYVHFTIPLGPLQLLHVHVFVSGLRTWFPGCPIALLHLHALYIVSCMLLLLHSSPLKMIAISYVYIMLCIFPALFPCASPVFMSFTLLCA